MQQSLSYDIIQYNIMYLFELYDSTELKVCELL